MLFVEKTKRSIDEILVDILHERSYSGPELFTVLKKRTRTVSKETFYRTLRALIAEEVINKAKKTYQLNRHWLQRMYRFSKIHIETNQGNDADTILSFKEGDAITYTFKNPNRMGIYWAHTYDMVFDQHDSKVPILIFHPHEWLIHTRVDSETFFLNRFEEDKKHVFFALGGTTELDKEFKKEWNSTHRSIGTGLTVGLKRNEYINVLGDFIFKISTSETFANAIDVFFKKYKTIDETNRSEIEKICNANTKVKMVFMRSKKEAEKMRIKFKKYFYVPKGS